MNRLATVDGASSALTAHGHRIDYRADIDGLRAIAVLAVVGFHAFPRAVAGGFVGVDIFFVISGYLISGILFREADGGRVDLGGFYVRRIRRIFPALTVVLLAVAAFGWLALTKTDYEELQKHIAAGSVFVSNIVLWRESGYFDAPSRFKPLLHLWSLGIEEQFYLLWPPIVYLCAMRRVHLGRVAAGIGAASLLVNVAMIHSAPAAAFYLPMGRMWELLLGALIAYPRGISHHRIVTRRAADLASWAGVALLGAAAFGLTSRVLYPGWWALLPTVGTALIIVAGTDGWVNRQVLARRPLVAIGLISYPLYLWHWPLLSFLDITEAGAPPTTSKLAAIALSFVLAALTYALVERPIRRSLGRRTPLRMVAVAASLLLVGGAALYARQTSALRPRTPSLVAGIYSRMDGPKADPACRAQFPSDSEYCEQYAAGGGVTTALLGDSHASHFLIGVGAYLARKGENVVHLGHSGCPPLLDLQRFTDNSLEAFADGVVDTCRASNSSVINLVANDARIQRVILSFNGAVPVTGFSWGGGYETVVLAGTMLSREDSVRVALERTVQLFVAKHKEVWLLLQIPELEFHLTECLSRPFSLHHNVRTPCAVPRAQVDARQTAYRQIVEQVRARIPELHVFDPWPYLCDVQWCHAVVNGELMYVDDNHLSREGSLFFADKFHF